MYVRFGNASATTDWSFGLDSSTSNITLTEVGAGGSNPSSANPIMYGDSNDWTFGVPVGIGGVPIANVDLYVVDSKASALEVAVHNTNTANGALAVLTAAVGAGSVQLQLRAYETNQSTSQYGTSLANSTELLSWGTGNLFIGTGTAAAPIIFGTNSTERMKIGSDGVVEIPGGVVAKMSSKTANYILVLADNGSIIEFNAATNVVVTVPASGFPAGWNVQIVQLHATTTISFIVSGGATFNSKGTKLASQYGGCTIYHRSGDDYVGIGDLTP